MKTKFVRKTLILVALSLLTSCGNGGQKTVAKHDFMSNGYTEYSILIPDVPMSMETFASNELVNRIYDASGIYLDVVEDKDYVPGNKYISLGDTTLFEEKARNFDDKSIDGTQSAYYRTYADGNIMIISSDDFKGSGVLYGVYDLLEELCDYKYFASDEIYVKETKDMKFYEYVDKTVRPSFDSRTISVNALMADHTYCTRLRNIMTAPSTGEWSYNTWGHGQIGYYVPYSKYGAIHPEWYMNTNSNVNSNQLCLSAGQEMEDIVFDKLCQFLKDEPNAIYFMFAQQDIAHGCQCDKCRAAINSWAGNYQGIQVDFMNRMIKRVETWKEENFPGRTIYYVVFGYQHTYQPPVKTDLNGNYTYISDRVIPNDKLRFMVAPVEANYTWSFDSPINSSLAQELKKWNFYANGQYMVYLYDTNFKFYFVNFNNFGAIKSMMETVKNEGVYYFFTQGCSDSPSGCFNELRVYVESMLAWNLSRDYETLKDEFMLHYYKDASKNMNEIFQMIRDQYALYDTYYTKPSGGNIYANILNNNLWPYELVRKMEMQIKEAFESIKHYESDNPSMYQTLSNRIYKEYLSIIYLKVKLYKSYCSEEELAELETIWNTYTKFFGFTQEAEGYPIGDMF